MVARLDWPQLWARIQPRITLKDGNVDGDGWVWARCIFPGNHSNGDKDASLHINVRSGGVTCFGCDFKNKNLNDLADALNVDASDESKVPPPPASSVRTLPKTRVPALSELAEGRMLPEEVLRFLGIAPVSGGYSITMDDPEAQGAVRFKAVPGGDPKYQWRPAKVVTAKDCVYGLTRIPTEVESVIVCAGEPDKWVLTFAGHNAISFMAGETSLPSDRAIAKVKAALPKLKNVVIVYDRDAAGNRGAKNLSELFLKLGGISTDVCTLPDTLPLKGDVTDLWKLCKGDKDAFNEAFDAVLINTEHFEPIEPKVVGLDYNHYRVELPVVSQGGRIEFDFSRMESKGHDLMAEITARLIDMPGFPKKPFSPTNVNFKSTNGREQIFKALARIYGESFEWESLLLEAMELARSAYELWTPGMDLFDAVETPMTFQIGDENMGFLPEANHAVLFGDGGVSKTQIGLSAMIAIAHGMSWQGMPSKQVPVMMIDAEANEGQIKNRVARQLDNLGLTLDRRLIHYWPAKGRPMSDMAEALRLYCRKHAIGYLLNDSVTMLCSGEPEKADQARSYFQSLEYIGVGSLSIAHVSHETGKTANQMRPFGSSFWHNTPRMTWNAQKVQTEGSGILNCALHNRKNNDGPLFSSRGVQVKYDGLYGPISITPQNIMDVPDFAKNVGLKKRILYSLNISLKTEEDLVFEMFNEVIAEKTQTPDEETRAWRSAAKQVNARLTELKKEGLVAYYGLDKKWGPTSNRQEEIS